MNSQLQNDNKIQIRKTIDIKANATVRPQGISLIDAFITNISTASEVTTEGGIEMRLLLLLLVVVSTVT